MESHMGTMPQKPLIGLIPPTPLPGVVAAVASRWG